MRSIVTVGAWLLLIGGLLALTYAALCWVAGTAIGWPTPVLGICGVLLAFERFHAVKSGKFG